MFVQYKRKGAESNDPIMLPFTTEDFAEVGFKSRLSVGMPLLEAHQLVNRWNKLEGLNLQGPRFIYWL